MNIEKVPEEQVSPEVLQIRTTEALESVYGAEDWNSLYEAVRGLKDFIDAEKQIAEIERVRGLVAQAVSSGMLRNIAESEAAKTFLTGITRRAGLREKVLELLRKDYPPHKTIH